MAGNDAGLTVLELVVALAIAAGLATMVAAAIRPPQEVAPPDRSRIADFVVRARSDAVLSGRAVLVQIDEDGIRYGETRLEVEGVDLQGGSPTLLITPDGRVLHGDRFLQSRSEAAREQ